MNASEAIAPGCVDSDTLVALLEGALPADRADQLDAHVDGCAACAAVVAELGALSGGGPRKVGRYLLERTLGSGAMGVVWAAWDPELQRRVAVKLVRGKGNAPRETVARARMVREARALARINHPNVVAVHDVGEHDGEVFVATELVDGETMAQWQLGRGWREVTQAWVQAARGLAAAHAEGLVHRDVKPANVFVGRDGRVRVGDFGLARTDVSEAPTEDEVALADGSDQPGRASDIPQLTATGHVAGTPGYMAPEQRRGPVDARADQFALCVALAEALGGRRPEANSQPAIRDVPAALIAVLARGLRADPVERYPTIAALADGLAAAAAGESATVVQAKPRTPLVVALGIAVVAAAGVVIAMAMRDGDDGSPTPTPTPVALTPSPTPSPSPSPSLTPSPSPSLTPSPSPSLTPSPSPPPSLTPSPSPSPSPQPGGPHDPPKPKHPADDGSDSSSTTAPTPTATATLDPLITPSVLVYSTFTDKPGQDAQTARDHDDGAACLAALGAASATDPPNRVVLRGTCEMMTGKCGAGAKRIRALPFANAIATDASMKWIEVMYCPSTEGDLSTRVHRFEAQVVLGTRVSYSVDRYIKQLEALTDDAGVANVPAAPMLGLSDGPTAVAKGYFRIVPLLRSMQKCTTAAALAAKATAAGISMPDDQVGTLQCP